MRRRSCVGDNDCARMVRRQSEQLWKLQKREEVKKDHKGKTNGQKRPGGEGEEGGDG